ncbi:MAG: diguanylate cyclase [Coxiellaceae bacterium]|nr:MAG: diguanylate cyclase [Coxiellaceae bacterium]
MLDEIKTIDQEVSPNPALHDPVTGLLNRNSLHELLNNEIARAERFHEKFAVVVLEIENLSNIILEFGDAAGKHILKTIAMFLKTELRNYDLLYRHQENQFLIIMPKIKLNETVERIRQLTQDIKNSIGSMPINHCQLSQQRQALPVIQLMLKVSLA